LEAVPQYVKGRITIDKINTAIDEVMLLLKGKYKLMNTPEAKLSSTQLKRLRVYISLFHYVVILE